jgi:hypothetical protein
MKIPVFVSCPTSLSESQQATRTLIDAQLEHLDLEPRALGRSDYAVDTPLREVLMIARHCAGGLILGYSQLHVDSGTYRSGTDREEAVKAVHLPTPWNQLEAGILYSMGLPLLVFCEPGVSGGIFHIGTSDSYVHRMPTVNSLEDRASGLREVFLKWQGRVRERYYRI